METHNKEMLALRAENNTLKVKLGNNEKLNWQLHERLKRVESRLLERNITIKGIPEILWEPYNTTLDKVQHELSELMEGDQ